MEQLLETLKITLIENGVEISQIMKGENMRYLDRLLFEKDGGDVDMLKSLDKDTLIDIIICLTQSMAKITEEVDHEYNELIETEE